LAKNSLKTSIGGGGILLERSTILVGDMVPMTHGFQWQRNNNINKSVKFVGYLCKTRCSINKDKEFIGDGKLK